jgi:hypothetical protein
MALTKCLCKIDISSFISVSVALYGLVLFYTVITNDIRAYNPSKPSLWQMKC